MKIIQAMKRLKEIEEKRNDLRTKIAQHSAYLSNETPMYADQRATVTGWLQACRDLTAEEEWLRVAIARTNLATPVTIEIGANSITKPIAAWVLRRRILAQADYKNVAALSDRNLREGTITNSQGQAQEIRIVRCYSPEDKDRLMDEFRSEPHVIDGTLEIVNAVTDLIES